MTGKARWAFVKIEALHRRMHRGIRGAVLLVLLFGRPAGSSWLPCTWQKATYSTKGAHTDTQTGKRVVHHTGPANNVPPWAFCFQSLTDD